jgi:hydroxyacylglutathione hydrolase
MIPAEVTWLDERTVQIRQPKVSHWEAPFLYLLLGDRRALLIDTGATCDEELFPLRATVDALCSPRELSDPSFELVVAHSHAHGDHRAGDPLVADRPRTRLVGTSAQDVAEFFGFTAWPDESVAFDLGGRTVDVIGGPGHEPSAVVFADHRTGIAFTGDTVCPGHLYVRDEPAFRATIERLIRYRDQPDSPMRRLFGAHIEMSSTGRVYPPGTTDQPDEAPLAQDPAVLDDVLAALRDPAERVPGRGFVLVRD